MQEQTPFRGSLLGSRIRNQLLTAWRETIPPNVFDSIIDYPLSLLWRRSVRTPLRALSFEL